MDKYIRWFNEISMKDLPLVGGKNASLGEMFQALTPHGIQIPQGFAITADAFSVLIQSNHLEDKIYPLLEGLNSQDTKRLSEVGLKIRSHVRSASLPEDIQEEIRKNYEMLSKLAGVEELDVAVRSSATAEDLPGVSFAGQQETFLNVRGVVDLLSACRNCFASLFTDRAISYRVANGFEHSKVKLSIGIQQMVRSDLASSGVIFTLDTESGARNVILINSSYGLGENIVGGRVDPDEFVIQKSLLGKSFLPILRRKVGSKQLRMVYSGHGSRSTKNIEVSKADQRKLSISDDEVMTLANWSLKIEEYYSNLNKRETPMDIEWAKDGKTGDIFILQARPETIHSNKLKLDTGVFVLKERSKVLITGRAVGMKIGAGPVKIIRDVSELHSFQVGDVLVTDMTDPDWEPVMKKASAIVTNRGGRTCHAAIISREHGVPCVVGTESATELLNDNQNITVSCAEGDEGIVYEGILPFKEEKVDWKQIQKTKTKIMVNMGNPAQALTASLLPVDGVGLVRIEFIITESIRIHPMALAHYDQIKDLSVLNQIRDVLGVYGNNPEQYFIDKLSEGVGIIAGAFYPRPVIVRFSDFKTNEYASLVGGKQFESSEENPMIGFRGASRYYDDLYRDGFALECKAIKKLREVVGLTNIKVMIPFCRSPEEGQKVIEEMKKNGIIQGEAGLEIYVMSEIPTNVLRAQEFAKYFDGFSIGSNDLTQMVLGVDRDSSKISHLFNEKDPAVLKMLQMAISAAKKAGRPIGICGQAPSDYPEISELLVKEGINSISVTTDAVFKTIRIVSEVEKMDGRLYESRHV
ncbi:phosphoenolpyruvate synthase [Bacteriovorax sp. PP10]|uniref:Phosphoenolpyruvate synthase n=1 Tax=Bacteriovorax antarcticus TaxID=3088717 RepID=A0ABU5VX53_9BACT|nr:phosphoenolpyruvate synthase [Bacteriovorax sp. PP10]MEA9357571.1 phosphoenolpyruvate synthase [Bacteriovorax sp. PP10]